MWLGWRRTIAEMKEPIEQPYGVADSAVRDPAGNLIRINERAELAVLARPLH